MAWGRLDPDAPFHPKFIQAGPLAFALFCAGICYAVKLRTDGFIPTNALYSILPGMRPSACKAGSVLLVTAELWEVRAGGWQIHDFLKYNESNADRIAQERATYEHQVAAGKIRAYKAARIRGRFVGSGAADQPEHQPVAGIEVDQPEPGVTSPQTQTQTQTQTQSQKKKSKNQSPAVLPDDGYLLTLKTTPAYEHIDVLHEFGKAQVWAAEHHRVCTRRFFLNWLNRISRPMAGGVPPGALSPKTMASLPVLQRFVDRRQP